MAEGKKDEKVKEEKEETKAAGEDTAKKSQAKKSTSDNKSIEDILSAVENMTVLELSELVKALEEKFNVSAQAMVAAAPAGAGAPGGAAPEEEKSEFDVELKSAGQKKIEVIKAKVSAEEAEKIKKQLEDAGAEVELK